jgi:5-methylcytosine-specific restriction endonuclease McrA
LVIPVVEIGQEGIKFCGKCSVSRETSEFHRDKSMTDGLRRHCRSCVKAYDDQIREQRNKRAREIYAADPASKIAKTREYHLAHPEWSKQKLRESHLRHAETRLARVQKRLVTDPEFVQYRRDVARRSEMRRRALLSGSKTEAVSQDDLREVLDAYNSKCWICGITLTEKELTWDHYQPIKAGGDHSVANLRPACGPCNCRKNARWPFSEAMRLEVASAVRALRP